MKNIAPIILFLVLAFPAHAGMTIANGREFNATLEGMHASDWSYCSSVVAYWKLDETGSNDRVPFSGSCPTADCTLTAAGSPIAVAGVRDNAVSPNGATGNYLLCTDATCNELDFTTTFSFTQFVYPAAVFGAWYAFQKFSGSAGYFSRPDIFFTADEPSFWVDGTVNDFPADSIASSQWNFVGGVFDDTSNTTQNIVSSETLGWQQGSTVSVSAVTATAANFLVASFSAAGSNGYVDELAMFDVALTEAEQCRICSCYLDGTGCRTDGGTAYIDSGWNATYCGSCTLPDANASCPT